VKEEALNPKVPPVTESVGLTTVKETVDVMVGRPVHDVVPLVIAHAVKTSESEPVVIPWLEFTAVYQSVLCANCEVRVMAADPAGEVVAPLLQGAAPAEPQAKAKPFVPCDGVVMSTVPVKPVLEEMTV
jgi:hypothetical protein